MSTYPLRKSRPVVDDLAEAFGVRPFVAPACPRCGTQLADKAGNPRWEIVGRMTLVCLGGCPKARR